MGGGGSPFRGGCGTAARGMGATATGGQAGAITTARPESAMPNLSIKDVPESIAAALRQRAARNHRSLQGELMALVE